MIAYCSLSTLRYHTSKSFPRIFCHKLLQTKNNNSIYEKIKTSDGYILITFSSMDSIIYSLQFIRFAFFYFYFGIRMGRKGEWRMTCKWQYCFLHWNMRMSIRPGLTFLIRKKSFLLTPFRMDTPSFESHTGYKTSSCRIDSNRSSSLSASKGGWPAIISYIRTPRAHQSTLGPYSSSCKI